MRKSVLLAIAVFVCSCGPSSNDGDALPDVKDGEAPGDAGEVADTAPTDTDLSGDLATDAGDVPEKDTGGPVEAGYKPVGLAPSGSLFAVWGMEDTVLAVGEDGVILRRQGSHWSPMKSPVEVDLHCVFGEALDDVWAAGADGTVLHWNGVEWAEEDPEVGNLKGITLRGAWGEEGHLYLVGDKGTILHKAGPQWSQEEAIVTYDLVSIWGPSLVDIYVGASGGTILRKIGGAWSSVQVAGGGISINGLYGLSNKEVWAGGSKGTIAVLEGAQWVPKVSNDMAERGLNAVWAFAETDVFHIGDDGVLVHSDDSKWNMFEVEGPYYKNRTFHGLWGRHNGNTNEAWAVGEKGAVLRYDSTAWKDESSAPQADINSLTGSSGDSALATGGDGLVLLYDGSDWTGLNRVTTADLVGAAATDDGYVAVGDNGDLLFVEGSKVTLVPELLDGPLGGLCAGGDLLAVVGEQGKVLLSTEGADWDKVATGIYDSLNACAVDGSGTVTAVGDQGRIIRVEGGNAQKVEVSTVANLHDIAAAEDGTLYVVGDNGLLMKLAGGQVEKLYEEPGLFLYGVHPFPDRVVAVGWAGRVLTYFPDSGDVETEDVENAGVLQDVWGASPGHYFIAGKKGRLLEYVGD